MTRRYLKGTRAAAGLLLVMLAGACADLTVPDYNNPEIDEFVNNPTPSGIRAAATGLFIGARAGLTDRTGYVSMLGVVGRESYTLDSSDPRYVGELLQGPLSNSGAFGAGMWTERYANIRNANILLGALDRVAGMTDAEKEATRGFAKTMQALDFLLVINTRDLSGAPIEVGGTIRDAGPFVGKAQVLGHVIQLLDEARVHLLAGGTSFPFAFSAGFAGFNTPATFLTFNRAIKARTEVYMGAYAAALISLGQSFLNPAASLDLGPVHLYSTSDGQPNDLNTLLIFARPQLVTEAQLQPGGAVDARVARKIGPHPEPRTAQGVGSDKQFLMYPTTSATLPVIRNEELLLLRAEARWFTGDRAGAMADLNLVRQSSGGLAAAVEPTGADATTNFVTLLLYERKYSLLFEGGHRWIDARRFGRLEQLGRDVGTHVIVARWSIPEAECLARDLPSPCNVS